MNQVVIFGDNVVSRPLSIYTLASHLNKNGVTAKPLWVWKTDGDTFDAVCRKYISKDTVAVGISASLIRLYTPNFFGIPTEEFQRRVNLIKSISPSCKIIVGGSQVPHSNLSTLPEVSMIDLFVEGQGEHIFLEIVQSIIAGKQVKTISLSPKVTSDQLYPYLTFSKDVTDIDDFVSPREALPIELARGCIFRCSYCTFLNGVTGASDYVRKPEVLRDIFMRNYEKYGTTNYYVLDDLINDSEEKVDMILEVSKSLPFKLSYTGYIRLDMIWRFPSMAQKLLDSGLIGCFMGIETINDESGKAVKKGLGRKRTDEGLAICHAAWKGRVFVTTGIILGLPHDDSTTKTELLNWLNEPATKAVIQQPYVKPFGIIHESKMENDIEKNPAKYGYTFDGPILVNNTMFTDWHTDKYSFQQAKVDAQEVHDNFFKTKKYSQFLNVFELPVLLSMSDHPDEILDMILHDRSTLWADSNEFKAYRQKLLDEQKSTYINRLLSE